MSTTLPEDLRILVNDCMTIGLFANEEAVLRIALTALSEQLEDIRAIREGLDDWRSGDEGIPLDQAFNEILARHSAELPS